MSDLMSRRGIMASIAAALLAPLAAKVRTALARGRESEAGAVCAASGQGDETAGTWNYDDCARPETDGVRQVSTYCYDAKGRLVSVIDPVTPVVTTFVYEP